MVESELIQKLQKGDQQAFSELVQKYRKLVVNTCYGMVHSKEDAEDIAQEVFIEVFRSVNHFRAEAKVSTWLYKIAINRSLNFIRDNKRRKSIKTIEGIFGIKNPQEKSPVSANNDNPGTDLENRQRAEILYHAIDSLPVNQKTAFTLHKYEDLAYKDVADVMELSLSSVESLIHRAKLNLQKKLYDCYKKKCF